MSRKNKKFKIGDIIRAERGRILYQIIDISESGMSYKIKHSNGVVYSKTEFELVSSYCKVDLAKEDFDKLHEYKDYPDHLRQKETIKSFENEKWVEIKIKNLKHSYQISSLGRVKETDHYGGQGYEYLLKKYGNNSYGIPIRVVLTHNNDEKHLYLLEELIKDNFPRNVFTEYKLEQSKLLNATLGSVKLLNEFEEIDFSSSFEGNDSSLPKMLIFNKRYQSWYEPNRKDTPQFLLLEGFSSLEIVYYEIDKYKFTYFVGNDSKVIDLESPIFNQVVKRDYKIVFMGYTNRLGFKELIAHIRSISKFITEEMHKNLVEMFNNHLHPCQIYKLTN